MNFIFYKQHFKIFIFTGKQEGCHFEASTQRTVIKELRSELDRHGLSEVEIAASDESKFSQALSTWKKLGDEQGKVDVVQVGVARLRSTSGS